MCLAAASTSCPECNFLVACRAREVRALVYQGLAEASGARFDEQQAQLSATTGFPNSLAGGMHRSLCA